MNRFETCLLLAAIPIGLVAAGYWLATGLRTLSAAERLATAMLGGVFVLTWTVSIVNLALPLGNIWGWACLLPWVAPLLRQGLRRQLIADFGAVIGSRRGALLAAGTIAFLGALLWPLFSRPEVVYYDGTSGHDAFFWVVGAEHLKRQTYLQPSVNNPVYPLYYSIEAIVGLKPNWGRMGAEGLLALVSNLVGASPLKIYVAATAALFFPWVAAVFLVLRTFLLRRTTAVCALTLVTVQPVFLFFHANANLPNLLGAIAGAGVVVAVQRALTGGTGRWPWLALLVLSGHALLCCYPEMVPGVALSGGLLLAWAGRKDGVQPPWPVLGAVALALLVNPVTAWRAGSGFIAAMGAAAHSPAQGSIFDTVAIAARAPAMVTLSASAGRLIGPAGGVICCALLVVAGVLAVRRSHHRFGAMAMLAGGMAILGYTVVRHYPYGWQKTVQFCGVFLAALLPFGLIGHVESWRISRERWRGLLAPVGAVTAAFFVFATVVHLVEIQKWAGRKYLTRDWFAAREFSRKALHNVPVQVEAGTFDRPFFYTMWASYFLDESRVYFTAGRASGGYLRPSIEKYPPDWREAPRAMLIAGDAAAASEAAFWRRGPIGFAWRAAPAEREPKQ